MSPLELKHHPLSMRTRMLAPTLLLLIGQALGASPDQGEALSAEETDAVRLLRTLRDPEALPADVLGPELAALGPGIVGCLLGVLESGSVPGVDGQGRQTLSESQSAVLLRGLTELGRPTVLPYVTERYEEPATPGERSAAILVFGAVGEGSELRLMLDVAIAPEEVEGEPVEVMDATVAAALRSSVTMLLTREPRSFRELDNAWSALPNFVLGELVLGVGATHDPRALAFMDDVFERSPEMRERILSQVPLLGASEERAINDSLASKILVQLNSEQESTLRAACLALGGLEDSRCVPRLVELLGEGPPAVAQSAHWALGKLLNRQASASFGAWRAWLRDEQRWLREEEPTLLRQLRSAHEEEVLAALRAFSPRRLNRHELAIEVGVVLTDPSERVRQMACIVLAELGSRWSIRDLCGALDDQSDAVREAAQRALQVITGQNLGADPESWREVLAPAPERF